MLYHGQIIFKEYTVHREGGKKSADMQCIRADTLNFEKRATTQRFIIEMLPTVFYIRNNFTGFFLIV